MSNVLILVAIGVGWSWLTAPITDVVKGLLQGVDGATVHQTAESALMKYHLQPQKLTVDPLKLGHWASPCHKGIPLN